MKYLAVDWRATIRANLTVIGRNDVIQLTHGGSYPHYPSCKQILQSPPVKFVTIPLDGNSMKITPSTQNALFAADHTRFSSVMRRHILASDNVSTSTALWCRGRRRPPTTPGPCPAPGGSHPPSRPSEYSTRSVTIHQAQWGACARPSIHLTVAG